MGIENRNASKCINSSSKFATYPGFIPGPGQVGQAMSRDQQPVMVETAKAEKNKMPNGLDRFENHGAVPDVAKGNWSNMDVDQKFYIQGQLLGILRLIFPPILIRMYGNGRSPCQIMQKMPSQIMDVQRS